MDSRKVLLIGIDGGSWTVLQPAIDQGFMPFLKRLCQTGASGILESTVPAITPAAWGAFQTGKNPGKTGVFDFAYWDRERHESQFVSALDLGTTIWDVLSAHGKNVAIINVPMTYPPRPINGYMISGILVPSMESDFTWPRELKQELLKEIPQYHIFDIRKAAEYRLQNDKLEKFIGQMISVVENRTAAALWILKKKALDVFMVHFQASDFLQHAYWHCLDPTHPRFDVDKRTYIFEHFYRTLDAKIEQVFNAFVEKNGTPLLYILSDHGFQSHYKRFNLGNWLEQEGYCRVNPKAVHTSTPLLKKMTRLLRIGKWLSFVMPQSTIQQIDKKYISKDQLVQWSGSLAVAVGRSNEGFIYLLPSDNAGKADLAKEISEKLSAVRDPDTGQHIVETIRLKSEMYHGEKMDQLPDLVIEPADGYSFTGYYQYGQGLFHTVTFEEDMHIGKHHKNGIMIVSGEGIKKQEKVKASILDVAPTLLSYLGVAIPEQMDGCVQKDLFEDAFLAKCLPGHGQISESKEKPEDTVYSARDRLEIEQRLKDLGYL